MASKTKMARKKAAKKLAAARDEAGPERLFPATMADYLMRRYGHPDGPDTEFVGLED